MSFNAAYQVSAQTPPARTASLSGYRVGLHTCAAFERAQGATPLLRPVCPSFLDPMRTVGSLCQNCVEQFQDGCPTDHDAAQDDGHIHILHTDDQSEKLHWSKVDFALKGHNE